ncbi:TetR/AcrR family transcriptional regulator [Nocardia sp. NPDC057668]|uniref:TetR/AcrR family transcriptional regulator n=1 Tax=Nocardia sp. NPDC057668 TaxID=3346202 RepID=UPI0036713CC0
MSRQAADPGARPDGLRARKKQRTRENISSTATELFLERGYDAVTIAEIAAAADVAKMTVTNYFPRKEDLVLDLAGEYVGGLAAVVRAREPGESALHALRRAYEAAARERDPVVGFSGPAFAGLLVSSPALLARLREFHEERENRLADALAAETDSAADDFTPRVAAALLGSVHRALFEETLRRAVAGESNDVIAAAVLGYIATAFDTLEPALGTYAVRAG